MTQDVVYYISEISAKKEKDRPKHFADGLTATMLNGKLKALTFSYDDGVCPDGRLIEILDRYKMRATFNINTAKHPKSDVRPFYIRNDTKIETYTYGELREIYKNHELACHSLTHPHLELLDRATCRAEVLTDMINLEAITGEKPVGMAYPFGTYNDETVEVLSELGISYCRTTRATHSFEPQTDLLRFDPTCHHKDGQLMELAKRFIELEPETPQIFYVWGHTYEFEIDKNWDVIERFCELLAGRDDIFYGTNKEVLLG